MELLPAIGSQLCTTLPLALVWLVGAVVAVVQLSRRRRTSLLVLGALGIVAFNALVIGPIQAVAPQLMSDRGMAVSTIGSVFLVAAIARTIALAVAWALVLAAVFLPEPPPEGAR